MKPIWRRHTAQCLARNIVVWLQRVKLIALYGFLSMGQGLGKRPNFDSENDYNLFASKSPKEDIYCGSSRYGGCYHNLVTTENNLHYQSFFLLIQTYLFPLQSISICLQTTTFKRYLNCRSVFAAQYVNQTDNAK